MAPSPENDTAPKAPDKGDGKSKCQDGANDANGAPDGDGKDVNGLDDGQLKALLDEAIMYKSPKDRVGMSLLFNNLLVAAEDDLRNQRATSASGPEFVRYYNTTATRRHRNRRQPSSISENLTHGGSLNDLAKEELFGSVAVNQQRPKKSVSARQREGGSLPCNVNNVSSGVSYDRQFFDDACKRKQKQKNCTEYSDYVEKKTNRDHHSFKQYVGMDNEFKSTTAVSRIPTNYTTNAKIDIGVDEGLSISTLEVPATSKSTDAIEMRRQIYESAASPHTKFGLVATKEMGLKRGVDDGKLFYFQKVDENCNAVAAAPSTTNDSKKKGKKKAPLDRNVTVMYSSHEVTGHRSDIIDDLDKLVDFIAGNEDHPTTNKSTKNVQKSHKLHKNLFDEQTKSAKKRTRVKDKGDNLQKSNSLEEMSTSKLEDFSFSQDENGKVALRPTKSNVDRPRERRSWCNTEQISNLYVNAASAENLETADFRVVTKKKKSKKRRSSSSGRSTSRQTSNASYSHRDADRIRGSPEPPRRKSAVSVPHSEKSNDSSSDVDSVHSLPIDTERRRHQRQLDEDEETDRSGCPISYAEIAKNTGNAVVEKPKIIKNAEKKKPKIQNEKVCDDTNKIKPEHPIQKVCNEKLQVVSEPIQNKASPIQSVSQGVQTIKVDQVENLDVLPTEINYDNYIQNFPSIPIKSPTISTAKPSKNSPEIQNWPAIGNTKLEKTPTCNSVSKTKTYDNNLKNLAVKHSDKSSQVECNSIKMMPNNIKMLDVQRIITNNNEQPLTTVYKYQNFTLHIPDVRTIENLHFKRQMHQNNVGVPTMLAPSSQAYTPGLDNHRSDETMLQIPPHQHKINNVVRLSGKDGSGRVGVQVDANNRTSSGTRPAVVILSGSSEKDVSGITFGFDINEQLLSSNDVEDVCADFLARFVAPKIKNDCMDHNRIVNFIGIAWEEVINEGKVEYYTEEL